MSRPRTRVKTAETMMDQPKALSQPRFVCSMRPGTEIRKATKMRAPLAIAPTGRLVSECSVAICRIGMRGQHTDPWTTREQYHRSDIVQLRTTVDIILGLDGQADEQSTRAEKEQIRDQNDNQDLVHRGRSRRVKARVEMEATKLSKAALQ